MQINVESKIRDYSIILCDDFEFLKDLSDITPKIVVIDRNVWNLYNKIFSKYFKEKEILLFDAIEANKTIENVLMLCDSVMEFSAKKNVTIISFGGGIIQDVTGFLSSILYRGVSWIFVPTTLLAQADSCLGSKTSLNYRHYKNLLGSFYPPTKVFVNVRFTESLNEMDFYSGIGEVIKLYIMGGQQKIDEILSMIDDLSSERSNISFLKEVVSGSLAVKYSYIRDDEFDIGYRNLLNFGHCFGHAFEVSTSYEVPHGIAVIVGMIFSNIISVKRGLLSQKKCDMLFYSLLVKSLKCPLYKKYFNKEIILNALKMDKKRVGTGLPLIILKEDNTLVKLLDVDADELFEGMDIMCELLNIEA